jgi:molecular chaperone DnaJ
VSRDWLDKDFYAILGVSQDSTSDEIKKAYKKLARENHPDLNPGDTEAEKRFKEISEASSVLADEKKRQEYDQVRSMGASGFGGQGFNVDDFGDLFGNLGDIFGFGGSGGRRKGQTYQTNINISFNDAASGVETVIPLRKEVACTQCNGTGADKGEAFHRCNICNGSGQTASNQGFFSFAQTCTACKGQGNVIDKPCKVCRSSGSVVENESIKVKVPAGVDNGTVIRLRGRGGPGDAGAPDGDLLVQVAVDSHKYFKRKNSDLILEVPLLFTEAALGGSIKIPTLEKSVTLKIPAGTPSGKTFKIKREGITPQGRRPGDLYVKVYISPPTNLSRSAKKLLENYRDQFESGDSPRDYLYE